MFQTTKEGFNMTGGEGLLWVLWLWVLWLWVSCPGKKISNKKLPGAEFNFFNR